jgi:hypothetical protein
VPPTVVGIQQITGHVIDQLIETSHAANHLTGTGHVSDQLIETGHLMDYMTMKDQLMGPIKSHVTSEGQIQIFR